MIDTSAARSEVLGKIRAALRVPPLPTGVDPSTRWAELSRHYRRGSTLHAADELSLLEDRLLDYGAQIVHTDRTQVRQAVRELIVARDLPRMLVPPGVPTDWLPEEIVFTVDRNFAPAELDRFGGVLTGASLAIAETGTLVLQNVPGQGRRAVSLVPDYHLCLLNTADIVATVPEAMARLQPTAALPTTFISGPSATADIEMTRIKGVHGPRFLDVVLLS